MRHFFTKQLSDLLIDELKELCHGIGKTFEAVRKEDRTASIQTRISVFSDNIQEHDPSHHFSTIRDLHNSLMAEIRNRERLESELYLINETNRLLKQELERKTRECDYFFAATHKYTEAVRKLSTTIMDLEKKATFRNDGSF